MMAQLVNPYLEVPESHMDTSFCPSQLPDCSLEKQRRMAQVLAVPMWKTQKLLAQDQLSSSHCGHLSLSFSL